MQVKLRAAMADPAQAARRCHRMDPRPLECRIQRSQELTREVRVLRLFEECEALSDVTYRRGAS
jgi:hypothetical protein